MTRPAYFVILGAMRTGSNLLEKTLEALGDTVCYGELFNPNFIGGPARDDAAPWTVETRDAEPVAFLSDLFSRDDRLPGFRIFHDHTRAALDHVLRDRRCARIVLKRDPLESYISLKIARQTDQWVLRHPRRRISARVEFDAEEFAAYARALSDHYTWMDWVMAEAGTEALSVDYAALSDPAVMAGIARHIGSTGSLPKAEPILRQNPGALSTKVSNAVEMYRALGRDPEPEETRLCLRPQDFWCAPGGLHAYAPIDGPGLGPAAALLHRFPRAGGRGPHIRATKVSDLAIQGDLFPPVDADELAKRRVFTVVCDPLDRVYGMMLNELFGPGWKHAPIRRLLAEAVGPLPEGRGALRNPDAFTPAFAERLLGAYLDLIEAVLAGSGPFVTPQAWHSQTAQMAAYREVAVLNRVVPINRFRIYVRRQCQRVGVESPAGRDMTQILEAGRWPVPPIAEVASSEITAAAHRIYADDYAELGDLL